MGQGQSAGDLICLGCSIRLLGKSEGDIVALGGEIEVEGTLRGDAVAVGGGIRLGPAGHIGGDAVALGGPARVHSRAGVSGQVTEASALGVPGQRRPHLLGAAGLLGVNLVASLLGTLLLRRRRLTAVEECLTHRPGRSFLAGAIVAVTICLLIVAAAFAKNAAAIAVLITAILLAVAALWMAGFAGVCILVGGRLRSGGSLLAEVTQGALAVSLLEFIPVAGLLVGVAAGCLALGSASLSRFGRSRTEAAATSAPATP